MNNLLKFFSLKAGVGLFLAGCMLPHFVCADEDGNSVAAKMNKQWKSTDMDCRTAGSSHVASALSCNGILLKPLPKMQSETPDTSAEKKMTASAILYLRKDLNTPANPTGMILPAESALNSNDSSVTAACVRPVAVDNNVVRDAFGCGEKSATLSPVNNDDTDVSTCNQLVPGPEAGNWEWNKTCSLSVLIHNEFRLAMVLNKTPGMNKDKKPVQIWYRHWPDTIDKATPLALVYTRGDQQALLARQNDLANLIAVKMKVPVVMYTPGDDSPFSYHDADNKVTPLKPDTPEIIANRVIARYVDNANTSNCGHDVPAWQCSGLIARATAPDHPFTQGPETVKRGVASYFYLRRDTQTYDTYINHQGIVLKVPEKGKINTPEGRKVLQVLQSRMKCIYAQDADTFGLHKSKEYNQCRSTPATSDDYSDCSEKLNNSPDGDIDMWLQAYRNKHYTSGGNQCSFSVRHAGQFEAAISLSAQKLGNYQWNELILTPSGSENDIPEVEAVWYKEGDNDAKVKAQEIAKKYFALRKEKIPVIAWDYKFTMRYYSNDNNW
ncbi:hypothetical protein [Cedecea sp. NFIX57]|uniref:hypothetical protein n=1 Tax=Cedecea sp. NFIX57 TaxID=1566286 RepID=UPI000A0D10FC|nr:hypothetical protein [Cedecea sp. NFIX57]SMG61130.1 hypothetical protein SAMN03159353_104314 [Cedecea sp. NFIX57]